jgi:hypothetical protein
MKLVDCDMIYVVGYVRFLSLRKGFFYEIFGCDS